MLVRYQEIDDCNNDEENDECDAVEEHDTKKCNVLFIVFLFRNRSRAVLLRFLYRASQNIGCSSKAMKGSYVAEFFQ